MPQAAGTPSHPPQAAGAPSHPPQASGASSHPRVPRVSLNSDGQRHPIENGLAVFTLVAGAVSFATGWVVSQHMIATITGAASRLGGLYAQLISATRAERMGIVTGLVAGFVGAALGVAHGGFSG